MGIIVLAVAILPLLGVGGMQIYRAEMPGPMKDAKLTPRIGQTAKLLWAVLRRIDGGLHHVPQVCGHGVVRRGVSWVFRRRSRRILDLRRQHRALQFTAD